MGQVFGKNRYGPAYRKLVMLIGSSLVIWIPIEVLLAVSLCGMSISPEVTSWFAIFVLPVCALSNPFLYTIRGIMQKKTDKNKTTKQ